MYKADDEYVWENYTNEYSNQIKEMAETHDLLINKSKIVNGLVVFADQLHANWKELYHQVIDTQSKSVLECGCGSGQHLFNLYLLNSGLDINGVDLLKTQMEWGFNYYKLPQTLYERMSQCDMSLDVSIPRKFDFVYTQAVLMHVNTEKATKIIENMVNLSNKYVFMIERQTDHNYIELLNLAAAKYGCEISIERTEKYIDYGILATLNK
jgi:2-polyprenyl-3-methyl-5-hydroxy-6-metoxy-1,4-benzoquinol methylase